MSKKKEIKKEFNDKGKDINSPIIYKCEKCGYESPKTFLYIFEDVEYRYCSKCLRDFFEKNYPKAILKK